MCYIIYINNQPERNMNTIEQQLDASQNRRMAAEHRFLVRLEKREKAAAELIGELRRADGITYYINLLPLRSGKTKESKSYYELVEYLICNRYI